MATKMYVSTHSLCRVIVTQWKTLQRWTNLKESTDGKTYSKDRTSFWSKERIWTRNSEEMVRRSANASSRGPMEVGSASTVIVLSPDCAGWNRRMHRVLRTGRSDPNDGKVTTRELNRTNRSSLHNSPGALQLHTFLCHFVINLLSKFCSLLSRNCCLLVFTSKRR